jgi:phenylacetate-CoA ligase
MILRGLLEKIPDPIKKQLKYIYGYIPSRRRYGKTFWNTYTFLQESQWWSQDKLEEYQMQQLINLLHHAYNNVPYYRRIFNERDLKPEDIKDFNDLKRLSYLEKDDFKKHFMELIATNINSKYLPMTRTSGTSGKPLQFYQDFLEYEKEWAFLCHQWSRAGYNPGDPWVELRGSIIKGQKPIDYRPTQFGKVLRLSPKIDSKEIVGFYIEKMQQFGARFLRGYPSAIAIFSSLIKQYGFSVPFRLKAVLFASEAIYPWETEIVEEIFSCRIFSFYGMAEHVVIAGQCEGTYDYHCIPQYGITEIDPKTKEIIGTSFLNYVNPFIRYRTTDIASEPIHSGCSECGRQYSPVFPGVEGRIGDFIISPKGVLVSPMVITRHFSQEFKVFETIKNTQIVQKSLDHIKLRVVCWDNCDQNVLEAELKQICQGLQNILDFDKKIETEIVESEQLFKPGKFKWIISDVSKDFFEKGITEFLRRRQNTITA